ncbi:hypothetical protein L0156_12250 [bacterium]|nr:hypothetical protein [bacterium]
MAAEISRSQTAGLIPANMQAVNQGIVQAALSQAPEFIEQAIRSFNWISVNESQTELPRLASAIPQAGFVCTPVDYLALTAGSGAPAGEIVSIDQLLAAFRNHTFRFEQGVTSFLQSGIQEALAGLKPKLGPKFARPEILEPLNDMLSSDQVKNLNTSRFQPSMEAVNEMFAALKKVQSANSDLQRNMLRMIRA